MTEVRWNLFIISFCCFTVLSLQRMNMSIAMLCMVTEAKPANVCITAKPKEADSQVGEFPWLLTLQGQVHASYFYGLALIKPLEKSLMEKFSLKCITLIGMFLSSICNLITPIAARWHICGLMLVQIFKAMGHAIIQPAYSSLMCKWIPPKQLATFGSHATSGLSFGAFLVVVLTGFTCNNSSYSWPFIFHLTGSLGILWILLFLFSSVVSRNVDYFMKTKLPVPYGEIFSSKAFWSYVAAGMACYWIMAMNMFVMPIYFSNAFNINIEWTAVLSSFPNVLHAFLYNFSFTFLTKKIGSKTGRRRMFVCLGIFTFGILMVMLTFVRCIRPLGIMLMIIAIGASGCSYAAWSLIAADMSPNFAGILSCISNFFGAAVGSVVPIVVAFIIEREPTIKAWEKVFYVSFFVTFICMIIFIAHNSSEIQPWNNRDRAK